MTESTQIVLQVVCKDRPGILATLTPFLAGQGCDIRESAVYGDPDTGRFFVRMRIASPRYSREELHAMFTPLASEFGFDWQMHDMKQKIRTVIAVSKFDHCLNDLLHKWQIGSLPIDVVGVISSHETLEETASRYGVPYYYLPVTPETRAQQEEQFLTLVEQSSADLVILARYMQILSDGMAARLSGRCINIHHSFLPSFKGARPYHQAHARGVKLIGATAHYVTSDLDEGPIIEQDVRRVTHATKPAEMIAIGRETECSVLSRAVQWHGEHRVFLNEHKTVVLT